MSDVTLKLDGLDALLKALKQKPPVARIGVLGGHSARDKGSNATIGAVHEYGSLSQGIPQRSFLREPLTDHLDKRIESEKLLDADVLSHVIKEKSVIPWLSKIMITAHNIVRDAFSSGGFGKWPQWKNPKYQNNTGMILVDSTQLRDSITTEVKES